MIDDPATKFRSRRWYAFLGVESIATALLAFDAATADVVFRGAEMIRSSTIGMDAQLWFEVTKWNAGIYAAANVAPKLGDSIGRKRNAEASNGS